MEGNVCGFLSCKHPNSSERIKHCYTQITSLQLHADLSVYFGNGHNRWILYPEGSVYSSGLKRKLANEGYRFY